MPALTTRPVEPSPEDMPDVSLLVTLLNTRISLDHPDDYPERLNDLATADIWMRADLPEELLETIAPIDSSKKLSSLRALRNAIVVAADVEATEEERAAAWASIDAFAAKAPMTLRFTEPSGATGQPALETVGQETLEAAIVRSLFRIVESGRWSRIRLCARETCRAAFYDLTRSRTQRWHSYASCGNRSNLAAFRERGSAE